MHAEPNLERVDLTPSKLKSVFIALLIILAGLPLRWNLASRMYLDFDEAMYFQAANEPTLAATWEASRLYTHPPLAFWMYHEWLRVGDSEWLLRLPSIVLGAVATWIAYLWLSRVTDRRAALLGVFLLTFSLPVLHVSAQMRSYTLLFVFLFGALWYDERFRETARLRFLSGQLLCLVLALLTHYATAWVIGVLGVVGFLRAWRGDLSARAARAWMVSQVLLAGACVTFYLLHVRGFVGGTTQQELWAFWMHGNRFGESLWGRFVFALFSSGRFFGSLFGFAWFPMAIAALAGGWLLWPVRGAVGLKSFERVILVALPFIAAVILQTLKIYPFGATRHSLWLLPFVMLAICAAAQPLLRRPSMAWRGGIMLACLGWAWLYPVGFVSTYATKLTPELMRDTVTQWRSTISRDDLILTDEGTRNVLAYYLGRDGVDRGHDIAHGYREYRIDGFRVVTIPKFHFFMYSLREDWSSFARSLGHESTQPLWLVMMGFEVAGNDLKSLSQRLPPATILSRHTIADNHLLRLKFSEPKSDTAQAQAEQSSNASTEGERS